MTESPDETLRTVTRNLPGFLFRARLGDDGLPSFELLSFNKELADWLGITPEEGIADPARMLACIHPDDRGRHLRAVREAVAAARPIYCGFRIRLASGAIRWLRMIAHVFTDGDGRVVADGIAIDITREKAIEAELRESEARLRAITVNLPAAVFRYVQRPGGSRLAFAGPAIEKLTGRSAEALAASPLFLLPLVHRSDRASFRAGWREALRHGVIEELEFRLVRAGTPRWVRLVARGSPGEAGEVVVDGVLIDVDQRRRIAEELDRRNRELAVMNRISAIALASRDVDQAMRDMVAEMGGVVPQTRVTISLFDERAQCMKVPASTLRAQIGRRFPLEATVAFEVVRQRREILIADALEESQGFVKTMRALGERSQLAIPIRVGEQAIGALTLSRRAPRAFDEATIELARSYADAIATGIAHRSLAAVPETSAGPGVGEAVFGLTPRQRQVLDLLMRGLSNREIARKLGRGEATVKVHLRAVYQALGVNSRLKAVHRARELEALRRGARSPRGRR